MLDSLDITSAFDSKTSRDDYGGKTETTKLNKMRLCELICALEDEGAAGVFVNLVEVIGRLEVWFMTGVWT